MAPQPVGRGARRKGLHERRCVCFDGISRGGVIGVGKAFTPPLPPNRTGGFPAYGSPVDGFLIGTVSLAARPCPGCTAQRSRRICLASVSGHPCSCRNPVVSLACAASPEAAVA